MERTALYIRVSTQEQAIHGLSIEAQRASLEAWARQNGKKIVGVYADEGISARKKASKRPALQRLLQDVASGDVDLIAFTKLDRWFRNIAEYYKVQEILETHNVNWKTILEDYDTSTASGRLKINIMLSVAQDEADRTSERIKVVFENKRAKGELPAGNLPKGYRREGKKIVLDETTAPIVRAAFDMYFETGSPFRVIRSFPELHLNYRSCCYMLASPSYMGTVSGVTIPALITPEEHEKAVSMRRTPARKTKENRVYLFSGLIVCPVCGGRMGGRAYPSKKGDKYYNYYVCGRSSQLGRCTNTMNYGEKMIERYLLEHIDSKLEILLDFQKKPPTSHEPQRAKLRKKLARLSELWVDDLITKEDYKRQYDALTAELAAIPKDERVIDIAAILARFSGDWQSVYEALSTDGKRGFWRQCLGEIHLSQDARAVRDFYLR